MQQTSNASSIGIFPQEHLDQMRMDARQPDNRPLQWNFDDSNGGLLSFRKDSAESAFVARQLESIRVGVYKVQYPALKFSRLCPANTEDDTGAELVTFTVIDQFGQVLVSRDMSVATPMVEVKTFQQSTPIFSLRLGYQYSIQEARAAMLARRPLIADKAMAVREQMERKLDDIIAVGDTTTAVKGLLNQSSALTYTTPNGLSGSKTFGSKTADEVILDLNAAPAQIVSNSKEVEIPDTALFPTSVWLDLNNRRVGDGTSEQIATYWKRTTQYITNVETTFKSEALGTSTSRRAAFYRNDPLRVEYALPQPFEQFAPQAKDMMIVTHCHMRTAGVILKLPSSMIYMDQI